MSKKKRIFYLCNHKLLLAAECPIFVRFGFEIFLPKVIGNDSILDKRSMTAEASFDETLTISRSNVDRLNQFDFYSGEYSKEIWDTVNEYFGIIVVPAMEKPLLNAAQFFSGLIVIRAFGLDGVKTYEDAFTVFGGKTGWFRNLLKPAIFKRYSFCLDKLWSVRNRLVMACAYQSVISHETSFFKARSVYLPLGTYTENWSKKDTWTGGIGKIMFICATIDNPYYNKIYKEFKANFNDIPHSIFGKQYKEYPEDKTLIGWLSQEDYDKAFCEYDVMFYHSSEPRHIHNHPFEAIIFGMPLVFMSGGILEQYADGQEQPGMARTIEAAREKIHRILSKDAKFIGEVKAAQQKLVDRLKDDYIIKAWQQNFLSILERYSD